MSSNNKTFTGAKAEIRVGGKLVGHTSSWATYDQRPFIPTTHHAKLFALLAALGVRTASADAWAPYIQISPMKTLGKLWME